MASLYCIKSLRYQYFRRCVILTKQFSTSRHTSEAACLTSCKQLSNYLSDPSAQKRYRVLDTSWDEVEDCKQRHVSARIPGAKFFDLNECRNKSSPYPFMLPSPQQFQDYVGELGITNDDHVVIYEDYIHFLMIPSARLWWMFRVFGHDNVSILNGGLKAWIDAGYNVASGHEDEKPLGPADKFKATYKPELVRNFEYIKENHGEESCVTLLEARDASHMDMKDNESDISGKTVPGAIWTPFSSLLDAEKNSVLSKEEILNYFTGKKIDLNEEIVSTCEVGFTASSLSFCLYYACGKDVPVYDGSFIEWEDRVATVDPA